MLEFWTIAKFVIAIIVSLALLALFLLGLFVAVGLPIGIVIEADSKILGLLVALIYVIIIGGLIDWGISTHGLAEASKGGAGILMMVGLLGWVAIEDGL